MFKSIEGGILPTRGSKYSAFVDVYANEDVVIGAGETKLIKLGIAICEPTMHDIWLSNIALDYNLWKQSHYLQLAFRSSNAKKGLIMPTGFGVIDLDYEGEIMLPVHNAVKDKIDVILHKGYNNIESPLFVKDRLTLEFNSDFIVKKGDKIGQITLVEHKSYLFGVESD